MLQPMTRRSGVERLFSLPHTLMITYARTQTLTTTNQKMTMTLSQVIAIQEQHSIALRA